MHNRSTIALALEAVDGGAGDPHQITHIKRVTSKEIAGSRFDGSNDRFVRVIYELACEGGYFYRVFVYSRVGRYCMAVCAYTFLHTVCIETKSFNVTQEGELVPVQS